MYRQLPLRFEPKNSYTFETHVEGGNTLAVDVIKQCALGEGEQQIYLWSEPGGGKSHLLQAACNLAAKKKRTACYFPIQQIIEHSAEVLDELEQLDLVCLDDIEQVAQKADWERAVFNLINRVRAADACLIFAAAALPEAININLPDLQSRLSWGPVFQLKSLSDNEKSEALRMRALQRGLELPENVTDYLLNHYPRDLFGLFERLDTLDTASMAMQRKLTIPFVKSVLDR